MYFSTGDRVEVVSLEDEYTPMEPGQQGTVDFVNDFSLCGKKYTQVSVKWDNGRSIMACMPPDRLRFTGETEK